LEGLLARHGGPDQLNIVSKSYTQLRVSALNKKGAAST
jgi:hypothetical protein